jgi:uncharacterized membrane protein YpjA
VDLDDTENDPTRGFLQMLMNLAVSKQNISWMGALYHVVSLIELELWSIDVLLTGIADRTNDWLNYFGAQ